MYNDELNAYLRYLQANNIDESIDDEACKNYIQILKANPSNKGIREEFFVKLYIRFIRELKKRYPTKDENLQSFLVSCLCGHINNLVARYDESRSKSLLAYLYTYVFKEIAKNYQSYVSNGMLSDSEQRFINSIRNAEKLLTRTLGRTPTDYEIANEICGNRKSYSKVLSKVKDLRYNYKPVDNFTNLSREEEGEIPNIVEQKGVFDEDGLVSACEYEMLRDFKLFGFTDNEIKYLNLYFNGYKNAEIADIMGVSPAYVSSLSRTVVKKYQAVLCDRVS